MEPLIGDDMYKHIGIGIEALFPGATHPNKGAAEVIDDGLSQYVVRWDTDRLGPMPTLADLEEAGKNAIKEEADAKIKKEAKKDAIAKIDLDKIIDPVLRTVVEFLQIENRP